MEGARHETTDESFYELTTTPSGGDMIVGEPGTTILFDSSNGELVDVLPPSEAEDYSVTVSRGCADSNACKLQFIDRNGNGVLAVSQQLYDRQ